MLKFLSSLLNRRDPAPLAKVPDGTRYYVIGDVHGCLDLLKVLIAEIEADDAASFPADTQIVLLGDLVDRGPDSAGVVAFCRDLQARLPARVLAGNHEEMFLGSFEKPEVLRHFLRHGGVETVQSYGVSKKQFNALKLEELFDLLPQIVSQEDRDYLDNLEEMIVAGDYLFVHAGIDPLRPIAEQKRKDLLWIRDRFLSYDGELEKVVVHGHTIFEKVMDAGNRIGIDTGAYRTGVLTALVLEGDTRRIIQAVGDGSGPISVRHNETGDIPS